MQNWKFTYDLAYPVLVTIRDETTGYDFNFAFTVHLYRNTPYRGEASARTPVPINTVSDEDYCQERKIPLTVKTYELVENGMGVSYRDDLGGVNLSLTCLKYRCEAGATEYDYGGAGFAGLITNYPYCIGGILRGEKQGYKEDWERVVTVAGSEVELNLVPLYYFPVEKIKVVKHEFNNPENIEVGKILEDNEMALINLKYDSGESAPQRIIHEQQFVKSSSMEGTQQDPVQFLAKADFTYNLEVKLLDGEEFKGGYSGNWSISWRELEQAQEIIVHVLSKNNPSEDESVALLMGLGQNSVYLPLPEVK